MATQSEMPAATLVAPPRLIGYQEGAVVSRTLLKRAGGTITLFAFEEGQSLSEHTAPFDAVAHVLEGEADITIAGTAVTVPAGEMVLMPANQPHAVSGANAVQDAVDDDPVGLTQSGLARRARFAAELARLVADHAAGVTNRSTGRPPSRGRTRS